MFVRRVLWAGVLSALASLPLAAACSGSGVTFSCPAGSTSADVASAINAASDGAIITFASGAYSWTSTANFSNSKGATLICQAEAACVVSVNGTVLGMNGNVSGTNTKLYRISGFDFRGANGFVMWFWGAGVLTRLRIDHNKFTVGGGDNTLLFFGENGTVGYYYGSVDHNTVTAAGSAALLQYIGSANSAPPPSPFGTGNNLFVEDNTITIGNITNSGLGCMDSWGGAAIVWRYNTTTNCLVTAHGALHAGGPQSIELYGNTLRITQAGNFDACYRCFHHQGSGEFIAFNNVFSAPAGKNISALEMTHYRSSAETGGGASGMCGGSNSTDGNRTPLATYQGYPCFHQPGRDFARNLKPMYAWNNYWLDTRAKVDLHLQPIGGAPNYFSNHFVANRDYYNAVSASAQSSPSAPFNGSSGVGFGTLANRPATCATNTLEAGGGVAYFATDQGSQGTLYRCSGANTWTVHFVPYPYPHPLQGSTAPPPPPPPGLAPPPGMSAVVR
jgi:hypothetical protein